MATQTGSIDLAAASAAGGIANNALTSANGKNKIYHQAVQPTGGTYVTGDTWFDTDDGYKMYTYNGSSWVAEQFGENAIANLAITNAKIADGTIQNAKIATLDAGKITTGTLNADRIEANSLTLNKMTTDTQAAIDNSNIQVGGRNLVLGTSASKTSDVSNSGSAYVSAWRLSDHGMAQLNNTNDVWIISFDYETQGNVAEGAYIYTQIKGSMLSANVEESIVVNVYNNPSGRYVKRFKLTDVQVSATSQTTRMRLRYATDGATFTMSNLKLEKGNKATDWTPAPEDTDEQISEKKSIHTLETNYSYTYANILTYSADGYTGNWRVSSTEGVKVGDTVRLKVTVSDMSDTPVYVVGEVKDVTDSEVLKVKSHGLDTTVISGGNILTGSITADKLNVNSINASNSLTIGSINLTDSETAAAISNSNIEIGGKNLMLNTLYPDVNNRPKMNGATYSCTGRGTATTATHGIRFTVTQNQHQYIYLGISSSSGGNASMQGLTAGETYTLSSDFSCKLLSNDTGSSTAAYLQCMLWDDTSGSWAVDQYETMVIINQADKGQTLSGYFAFTFTLPTNITKLGFIIRASITTNEKYATGDFIELRNMMLEKSNKASNWSAAPEDTDAAISDAAKVATNYLHFDTSTGLDVGYSGTNAKTRITGSGVSIYANDTTNYATVDSNGMKVYKGGNQVAQFADTVILGKNDGTQSYQSLDFHSMRLYDKEGNKYLEFIDNRDANGVATLTAIRFGDGSTKQFSVGIPPTAFTSVKINGTEQSSSSYTVSLSSNSVTFTTAPTDGATVALTFTTTYYQAKAYTLGIRNPDYSSGPMSVAEGNNTAASGNHSHAEGSNTWANSAQSHAEGYGTQAIGWDAHAEGMNTVARGNYSHAAGLGTIANGIGQTVVGQYNIEQGSNAILGTPAFIVGNGTGVTRSNAFTVGYDGNARASAGVCGSYSQFYGTSSSVSCGSSPTNVPMVLRSEWSDIDGYTISSGGIIINKAGAYRVTGSINIKPTSASSMIGCYIGTSSNNLCSTYIYAGSTGVKEITTGPKIIRASAGDVLYLKGRNGTVNATSTATYLLIERIS